MKFCISSLFRTVFGGIVLGIAIMLFLFVNPNYAQAASNITTLSSQDELVPLDNTFKLTADNCEVKWYGVEGIEYSDNNSNNCVYYLPSKGENGNWSYKDVADFIFSGNYIGDQEVVITIHIDKVDVSDSHHNTHTTISKYWKLAAFYGNNFAITSVPDSFDNETELFGSNWYQWYVDYTVTITYADTGKVVEQPFFQVISDIDAKSNYFREAWTAKDGFSDNYYVYDQCNLEITGNTFSSLAETTGAEKLTKAGVIALTNNGQFSGQMSLGHCGSYVYIFSNFSSLNAPHKTFEFERELDK